MNLHLRLHHIHIYICLYIHTNVQHSDRFTTHFGKEHAMFSSPQAARKGQERAVHAGRFTC